MEPEGSLPSSQELFTCTYPEPNQSSPQESIEDMEGKARRKETSRRPRHMWMVEIKMDLKQRLWCGMVWIDLIQNRAVGRLL
jgi:hypothetical protein